MRNFSSIKVVALFMLLFVAKVCAQAQPQPKWKAIACVSNENNLPETRLSVSILQTQEKDEKGRPQIYLKLRNKVDKTQTFHLWLMTDLGNAATGLAELRVKLEGRTPQYTSLFSWRINSCSAYLIPEGTQEREPIGTTGFGNVELVKPTTPTIKPPTIKPPSIKPPTKN